MEDKLYGVLTIAVFVLIIYYGLKKKRKSLNVDPVQFPFNWRIILFEKVSFYAGLSAEDKLRFEQRVKDFLLSCKISGVDTSVDLTDKLLVACSAVIPVFGFPNWTYSNIDEVLIYPTPFNDQFDTGKEDSLILGMVGSGYMEGKMILSKTALHNGFSNESDKRNTGIHEFVHLIDKSDGAIDGVPSLLMNSGFTGPWLDMIQKKINEMLTGKSDIHPYGSVSSTEFFPVVSEYFYEQPDLLAQKHPELYAVLEKAFMQDMDSMSLNRNKVITGRNSPCPCNSGLKYKKCCGKLAN